MFLLNSLIIGCQCQISELYYTKIATKVADDINEYYENNEPPVPEPSTYMKVARDIDEYNKFSIFDIYVATLRFYLILTLAIGTLIFVFSAVSLIRDKRRFKRLGIRKTIV